MAQLTSADCFQSHHINGLLTRHLSPTPLATPLPFSTPNFLANLVHILDASFSQQDMMAQPSLLTALILFVSMESQLLTMGASSQQ